VLSHAAATPSQRAGDSASRARAGDTRAGSGAQPTSGSACDDSQAARSFCEQQGRRSRPFHCPVVPLESIRSRGPDAATPRSASAPAPRWLSGERGAAGVRTGRRLYETREGADVGRATNARV
jgi:hypothetical protein